MKYISLFSGIEAATVAWEPLGWKPVAFAEIERYCCALLAHRYPDVLNLGDVTNTDWSAWHGKVDIVVGGSPCQAFSVAGLRKSLDELAYALCNPGSGGRTHSRQIMAQMQVRRLTPRECERLQGFPDDYTAIPIKGKPAADGPRYRALGNSMAIPVMRWIGERIQKVVS